LALTELPGQTTSLTPQLSFVPQATEKAALKVARAKLWAIDKYMQLTPGTKAMIHRGGARGGQGGGAVHECSRRGARLVMMNDQERCTIVLQPHQKKRTG
jgi:hypothetical protein